MLKQMTIFGGADTIRQPKGRVKEAHEIIPSVFSDQSLLIAAIEKIHNRGQAFDLDPCYNKGAFYGDFARRPALKFDLNPIPGSGADQADCRQLPLKDKSIRSVIFDPPFIIDSKGGKMAKRFKAFPTYEDLISMYDDSLKEFNRILKSGGIVCFKCQDMINGRKQYWLHIDVFRLAEKNGFYCKDLFIFVNNNRLITPTVNQCHARKFHTYFMVLKKARKSKSPKD